MPSRFEDPEIKELRKIVNMDIQEDGPNNSNLENSTFLAIE
jgi:hypothetical protein